MSIPNPLPPHELPSEDGPETGDVRETGTSTPDVPREPHPSEDDPDYWDPRVQEPGKGTPEKRP